MRGTLQSQQEGDYSEPGPDQADDGHDLADPAPEIAPHQVVGRQQILMVAGAVDDADGEEGLSTQGCDLVEKAVRSDRSAQRPRNPVLLRASPI